MQSFLVRLCQTSVPSNEVSINTMARICKGKDLKNMRKESNDRRKQRKREAAGRNAPLKEYRQRQAQIARVAMDRRIGRALELE